MDVLSSVDAIIRILIYLVIGVLILIANLWYVRALHDEIYRDEIVIAPFQIIGPKDNDEKLGKNLAYMLQARLRRIEQELATAQESIKKTPRSVTDNISSASPQASLDTFQPSILPFGMRSVHIPTELLETTNIKLAGGGVEVGGVLPWLQQRIARPRTLNFAVIYDGETATVDGNIAPFSRSKDHTSLHLESKATDADIASIIAHALIQQRLSEDGNTLVDTLNLNEFRTLVK
jgi:hypothetical protein